MSIETMLALIMLPVLIILFVFAGYRAAFGFIAFVELVAAAIQVNLYLRTRNGSFIWMALSLGIFFIFALALAYYGLEQVRQMKVPLAILVMAAVVTLMYLIINKKIKWRTREILELSAMPVSGVENGFTERPLAAGKVEMTDLEMESFAAFVRENQIAIPYFEEGAVIFSLTSNYWKQIGLKDGYGDESWVRFDRDGHVSASISKEQYLKFKSHFSFDQLCQSLGVLFIDFFELYRKGEGRKVIERCDNLGLSPFIE